MEDEEFKKYVQGRYQKELEWYDEKSQENQLRYKILQWAIIVLAFITPVFIVLSQLSDPLIVKVFAIKTSILVAILSAGLRTFRFYDLWINYRTIAETLKKEIHLNNAKIDEYGEVDEGSSRKLFVERVESLI